MKLPLRNILFIALFAALTLIVGCSNAPKLATEQMPRTGFLPDYSLLEPSKSDNPDVRVWRYRLPGINLYASYKEVIIDPIFINQRASVNSGQELIGKAIAALQVSLVEAAKARGNVKIVSKPGPGVLRVSVGITGAEISADNLQPWDFTPVGMTLTAATYAAGVNSKTPALLIETKITDSQSNQLLGEDLFTIRGDSFRTSSESVDSFVAMVQTVVKVAMVYFADPTPVPTKQ